jgi:hypothetical protein
MTIRTFSKFLYGYTVDENNLFLNFDEGSGEITAQLIAGGYTFSDMASEIERALNEVGTLEYTVTTDRDTRFFTISATGNFDLLVQTGSNVGLGIFSTIGFTGSDRTGASSYESDTATGIEYYPQMKLQDYLDAENNQSFQSSNINESASGSVEVYSIGEVSFYEMNIKYINEYLTRDNYLMKADASAIANVNNFLKFCIKKNPVEFVFDVDDNSTFETIILEKTSSDSKGTGYKLKELYGQGLEGYFETGLLTFRKRV